MPKKNQTPASALMALMEEYQLNPFSLAKAISLSNSTVRQIVTGKSKITVPTALRLSKLFGQSSAYWLDLQKETDLREAEEDKELTAVLAGISKVKKPDAKSKAAAKPVKKSGMADKRKAAAKTPGARSAKRKPKQK